MNDVINKEEPCCLFGNFIQKIQALLRQKKKNVDFKKKMFAKMYRAFLLQATEQEEM